MKGMLRMTMTLTSIRDRKSGICFAATFVIVILWSVPFGARGADADMGGSPGEIISQGMTPFSETWDQMLRRDAEGQAAGAGDSPMLNVAPLPEEPRFPANGYKGLISEYAIGGRTVFLEPGPSAPQAIDSSFATLNMNDSGWYPPDTMGAVGPSHFMVVINGAVAIYDKTGTRLSLTSLDSFFTFTDGGTTYPRNHAFDTRVIFDRRSNRWFATALEFGSPSETNNNILLAVCRTNNPSTGTWDKYVIPVGVPSAGITYFTDFDTLGTDDNGVYFGMRIFPSVGNSRAKIAVTGKASLIAGSPSLGTVYQWADIADMWSSPQPALNHDAVAASGRVWFVSSSTTVYANVRYRTLTWSGGVPTLSGTFILTTPSYGAPLDAPASGSTTNIDVGDDRLQMAVIRNNRLWTCRNVGVNSAGGSSGADRTACEWLELNVSTATASLVQSGRVYDSAASDQRFYYYPSIMVSGQGHAAIGFSGSKSTEYVGAYTCGRLSGDAAGAMGAIATIKSGEAAYELVNNGRNRWGDYSYTSLDPNDDMSIWTIQEYAESVSADTWGTWTSRLLAPTPTLTNPNGNGGQGQTGVSLALTGTGFYDPGPGYASRLDVELTGGAINGISNYNVTYNSDTSVTVTFDIAGNATLGMRNIVLTNPDEQSVTVVDGFEVKEGGGGGTYVELTSFGAIPGNRLVKLSWETATEIDSAGFNVLRSELKDDAYTMVNERLIPSRGGPASGAAYAYNDYRVSNNATYYYKLEEVEFDGDIDLHGPVWATPGLIGLIFPSDGAHIPAFPSPTFKWSTDLTGTFWIEVSRHRGVGDSNSIRVRAPKRSNRYVLPRRHWRRAIRLARANNDLLYCRIAVRNSKPLADIASHVSKLTVQPSQISLVSPGDGAARNPNLPLRFLWRGVGIGRSVVQVCSDKGFSLRDTIRIRPRRGEKSVRMSKRILRRILALAAENDGFLYWRVIGREFGTGSIILSDEVRQLNIAAQ